jgi:hypothetical protein
MTSDSESIANTGLFGEEVSEDEVRRENLKKTWSDGARYIHWVGIAFLASFLITFLNALPPRFTDPNWQLNFVTLIISGGMGALFGSLLVSLAQMFNAGDRQVQKRALLVRTLASWVALGWLLLIPLQLFLSVRLIRTQAGQELSQIQDLQRITRAVRNATSEDELRAAMAKVPNSPPLPRLTVPLEVAKSNLLSQFQKTINTLENRQQEGDTNRWQTWFNQALRNCLQCVVLATGFLALGKNRTFSSDANRSTFGSQRSRSRSRG